ncbi:hypothetical protein MUGA111182_05690 [Mucilaginibacter galii]|uniref:Uncharacterized protein n=1 Tax=Mucilaginibacter galii TaxID=2005073 RepID=A0A917N0L1_9SPHI|nr:hypothetical protein GCM10011425_11670 [Mucilaginibacter galii]
MLLRGEIAWQSHGDQSKRDFPAIARNDMGFYQLQTFLNNSNKKSRPVYRPGFFMLIPRLVKLLFR